MSECLNHGLCLRIKLTFRSMDLAMWATHNAKERELEDWTELFRTADAGYKLRSVLKPKNSRLSILELIWASSKA